jgi:hypothetical protein
MTPRRSRPSRDPDRRPTPPKHPGFAQFHLDIDTLVTNGPGWNLSYNRPA